MSRYKLELTPEEEKILDQINPIGDNLIIKLLDSETKSSEGIILTSSAVEKSTEAIVLKPNVTGYHRNGEPKSPVLKKGDIVRLQRGNVGTGMPESPKGQEWLAVPEDVIYYYRRLI